SIFFGGGTPSTASPKLIYSIINKINSVVSLEKNTEITMEINPSTIDLDNIKSFYKSGVNRISIGVQSFSDKNLKFLGRTHNAKDAIKAINIVSNYFDNYSMDLIYDCCSDIYFQTKSILENSGFEHYEISNFASNKKYCVHNLNYWDYEKH
uniref:Radical SAM core domain-containing protein n=1 Tax=Biomphalaria glabrata TaxID=6526 RepID=A0A2C9M3W8_BIOGL